MAKAKYDENFKKVWLLYIAEGKRSIVSVRNLVSLIQLLENG